MLARRNHHYEDDDRGEDYVAPAGAKWTERTVTLGSLVVSVLVMLGGFIVTVVGFVSAQEQRWANNDRLVAVLRDRQDFVIQKNIEQDARITAMQAEQRAYLERMMIQLESNAQRLIAIEHEQQRTHPTGR